MTFSEYLQGKFTLIQTILTILMNFSLVTQLFIVIGQLLMTVNFTIFIIELYRTIFNQFIQTALNQLNKKLKSFKQNRLWKCFRKNYVEFYDETTKLNGSISVISFQLEMVSKTSIITSCMFYGQQDHTTFYNLVAIMVLMSIFVLTTGIYNRISYLPSCNQRCCRYLLSWIVRTDLKRKLYRFKQQQKILRNSIESNLSIQTMNENNFGFYCGQMFFITKYKYIELLLMNVPLVLLFYKKICMIKI